LEIPENSYLVVPFKNAYMNPIIIGALALLGFSLMKPKSETSGKTDSSPGGPITYKPSSPGSPRLEIVDVKPLLNRVKYTVSSAGEQLKNEVHKIKDLEPRQIKIGNHFLLVATDPEIRAGQKHPDAVMFVLKDADNKTVIAKRVLVEDDKIIDIV
jgi:hypothetical protein